jgi:ribosomal protein S12 methylthiotransferase
MLKVIKDNNLQVTNEPEDADIAIVNTCAFIGDAKEESVDCILELADMKQGNLKMLIVTGCLSQRYSDELMKEIPEIDGIIGTGRYEDINNLINEVTEKEQKINYVDDIKKYKDYKELKREKITPDHYAYLRIAEGCDNFCTYCIIPGIRGSYRSRKIEDIKNEAAELAEGGVKELIIIGEDITWYGKDNYGKTMLTELLKELVTIDKIQRIRLLYAYPNNITEELLLLMSKEEKICNYLDMPIQHISDNILKLMGRNITGKEIKGIINRARELMPDIVFRTSLISGFPGETQENHNELLEFVKEYKIERLGVFPYSKEEGTPAYRLKNQIPEKVKISRRNQIMEAQYQNVLEYNEKRVGKLERVIIDGFDGIFFEGRSCAEAVEIDPVILVKYEESIKTGDIINCRIIHVNDYDLVGEMESEFAE